MGNGVISPNGVTRIGGHYGWASEKNSDRITPWKSACRKDFGAHLSRKHHLGHQFVEVLQLRGRGVKLSSNAGQGISASDLQNKNNRAVHHLHRTHDAFNSTVNACPSKIHYPHNGSLEAIKRAVWWTPNHGFERESRMTVVPKLASSLSGQLHLECLLFGEGREWFRGPTTCSKVPLGWDMTRDLRLFSLPRLEEALSSSETKETKWSLNGEVE